MKIWPELVTECSPEAGLYFLFYGSITNVISPISSIASGNGLKGKYGLFCLVLSAEGLF